MNIQGGAYNDDDATISGAEFIERPSMGMCYQDEFDTDKYAVEATGIRGLIAQISANRDLIYDVTPREFEEIVELLIGQPRYFNTLRDVVKVLKAKPMLLKFHTDIGIMLHESRHKWN